MSISNEDASKNKCDDVKQRNAEILKLSKEGMGLTEIARKLGISRGSVYSVINKHKIAEI